MSSFQDFGPLSERRRAEKQLSRRKRLVVLLSVVSLFIVVIAIVVAAALLYRSNRFVEKSEHLHSSAKYIKAMCSVTDYREVCERSLSRGVSETENFDPKAIVRAAVFVLGEAAASGLNYSEKLGELGDGRVKSAVDLCKSLLEDVYDEIKLALDRIELSEFENIRREKGNVKNWLSAVLHYQDMCIDAFPNAEDRTKMKEAMRNAKQLTSNALAIVGAASNFLTSLGFVGRNLAENIDAEARETNVSFRPNKLPNWVSKETRRHLKERAQNKLKPNVKVAKDGTGNFTTINDALNSMPNKYTGRYVIYVKGGIYEEHVVIGKEKVNLTMYGDGSQKSIVTGSLNWVDGIQTSQTATFAASGFGLMLIGMGFKNTAGDQKQEAVALRVQSDNAVILNCRIEGFQSPLYAQTHRQFYRSSVISGTADVIFGDATAVFQNCLIGLRGPPEKKHNVIAAQARSVRFEDTIFVFQNCRIRADPNDPPVGGYLARPGKEYSRAVFMESEMGGFISPDGYLAGEGEFGLSRVFFGEYNNLGGGADTTRRVTWRGVRVLTRREAMEWTVPRVYGGGDFIQGVSGNLAPVRKGLGAV